VIVSTAHTTAPAQRGRTTIEPRVVSKIAEAAAHELGRMPRDTITAARARVRVDRTSAALRLVVEVVFPTPARSLAADLREHITSQVQRLTGLTVRHLEVAVVPVPPRPSRRIQ
jgi:uncharacterized alkaline shock family protein YloU